MPGRQALDDAVRGNGLVPHFQPIVSLGSGRVIGFEALARWPQLDGLGPNEAFAHAAATCQVEQLDHRCAAAAIDAALGAGLPRDTLVTVNREPHSAYPGAIDDALLMRARADLTLAFELTERSLLSNPRTLLSTVAALRDDGFLIALDDVGAHPDSLALLDVLKPDIIKLDMNLVQYQPEQSQARTIAAVLAYHERNGVPILAEGIENDDHVEHAMALGASLGQGFKYGYPQPISASQPGLAGWRQPARPHRPKASEPFDLADVSSAKRRIGRKRILMALSEHIERQANCTADPPMVLTALQHSRYLTPETRQRYAALARFCPLVAVFGAELPTDLVEGIRAVTLSPTDPLCAEWTVLALGPQLAVALIARERPTADHVSSEDDREFEFILTYDRDLVIDAAHSLLDRMT